MLGDDALDLVACADRNRRLNHDNGEILDDLADRASRVVNEMHVGRADLRQRRRADGDEDRLRPAPGLFQAGRERQPARGLIGEHQLAQARLVDRNATLSQTCDFALVDLDADDLVAKIGQTGPGNKADITRTNHHNAHRMNPHSIAASINAAKAPWRRDYRNNFLRTPISRGSTRRSNRHSPPGSAIEARNLLNRSRAAPRPSTRGEARRLTGLIHAAKRVRHRSHSMGCFNGRDMAVYTEVSDDALRAFLARYDIGEVTSFKGIAEGVENSNFLLRTASGQHILTLYEKRVKAEDLPFFIGLMEHLAERGVTCPQPVRDRAGSALGELAGRPAAIVTFLDGIWIRRPNVRHCGEVGEALARMHLAGADFPLKRANALSLRRLATPVPGG